MAIVGRDTGDEQVWRPAEMPRRVYSSPDAALGALTLDWLDAHRERIIAEEYADNGPRLMFARWLYARGRLTEDMP